MGLNPVRMAVTALELGPNIALALFLSALSMARRISSEVAPQNSPVWRAGISRWVERRLHCWAAFRDVLVWTG